MVDSAEPWLALRRSVRRQWWAWMAAATVGTVLFCRGLPYHDGMSFAVLLLLPIVSLRQAWRADRQLRACDAGLESGMSTTTETTVAGAQTATFAAGCFWGVEELFRRVPGVLSTRVGYTAGNTVDPTYEQVCTGRTNHAEALEVTFDPAKVSYQQLVELFFENHDPTTLNRQGPDVGTQYRSGVYYHSDEQRQVAEAELEKRQNSGDYPRPIVTEVLPAAPFYPAEEYHQQYFARRGIGHSCHFGNGKRRGAVAAGR
jgi:peptide-methionine (S)-S-oxide reductase